MIDRVQDHIVGGHRLGFPFWTERAASGLVWPEESLIYITPPLVLVAFLMELRSRR